MLLFDNVAAVSAGITYVALHFHLQQKYYKMAVTANSSGYERVNYLPLVLLTTPSSLLSTYI
jgi:hypothetical protein